MDQLISISEPGDLKSTLSDIAQVARTLFSADLCVVLSINPITEQLHEFTLIEGDKNSELLTEGDCQRLKDVAQNLIAKESDWLFERLSEDPNQRSTSTKLKNVESLVAISLSTKRRQKPLGVLYLLFNKHRSLDEKQQDTLKLFASECSSVLQLTWLLARYRGVVRIGQVINQELEDYESLFQTLYQEIGSIIDVRCFFMLAIYQPQTDSLDLHMNEKGVYKFESGSELSGGCAWVLTHKRSLISPPLSPEPGTSFTDFEYIQGTESTPPESLLLVPLMIKDIALGVLSLQSMNSQAYTEEDMQIMELLGNQVALAISNLRLFDYLKGIDKTAQQLTQELNSEQLIQKVADSIREITKAEIVILYPYTQADKQVEKPRVSGSLKKPAAITSHKVKGQDIAWMTLKKKEPVWAKDSTTLYEMVGGDKNGRTGDFEKRENVKSTAAVPLRIGGECVGALFVNFSQPQRFNALQRHLITSLANFAAITINNSRELGKLERRRVQDLEALREIDIALSQTLNSKHVMDIILQKANERIPVDESSILLYDPRAQSLTTAVAKGHRSKEYEDLSISVAEGRGIAVWAFNNKQPVRVGNVRDVTQYDYYEVIAETTSEMDVPLIDRDEAIGVISFESSQENAFSSSDELFLVTLAGQAVLAIKNAQLYERESRIAAELLALQDVEEEIISHLKLQAVMDTILEKALQITKSAAGQIMLYDKQRDDLYSAAENGVLPRKRRERLPKDKGIVGRVFKHNKLLNVNVCEPPWQDIYEQFIPGVCWELAVPISDGDEVRGVINIERPLENPFDDRDVSLLSKLADLATIAIQNAEQYESAESGKRRLEVLFNVDKEIISQNEDPESVMQLILKSARTLIGAEMGYLRLYENGQSTKNYYNRLDEKGEWPPTNNNGDFNRENGGNVEDGIVSWVAAEKKPYITRGDAQKDPLYKGLANIHSEVAVPMISRDGDLVGVLNMESPREFAFDSEDLEVLLMFAGQAVIAIQNARSFKEVEEASKRFKLLIQIARDLAGITDDTGLDLAYEIVTDTVTQHNDAEVIIRRYKESSQELVLACVKKQREPPPLPIIRQDQGINGQVARERRPIIIDDIAQLPEGAAQPIADPNIQTLVVIPIQFETRYYGNLILSHEKANYFKRDDVRLVKGLAQQLAITIHRVETVQARKEAEQLAKDLELFSELGHAAYEITHRLGNELGLVRTYVNTIRRLLADAGIDSQTISKELEKLLKDVGSVLKMSKGLKQTVAGMGDGGQLAENRTTIPVKTLLESMEWTAKPDNIEIIWKIDANLGNAKVVPGQILDVLKNLISNAIEAMPDGGTIIIRAFNSPPNAQIEVSDTGPGIPYDSQRKIFNLFFSTKKSSGFGLWSARRYARANLGDLTLVSQPKNGASFTLTLPIADTEERTT